jgi:hypothetical protein
MEERETVGCTPREHSNSQNDPAFDPQHDQPSCRITLLSTTQPPKSKGANGSEVKELYSSIATLESSTEGMNECLRVGSANFGGWAITKNRHLMIL